VNDEFIVGLDIGGTFTDAAALSPNSGRLITAKAPTTPQDMRVGMSNAISSLADEVGIPVSEFLGKVGRFAHATTQTSNVMFTWSGARVGLITTRGFRDELLIMRARGRVAGLSASERRHLQATNKPPHVVAPEHIVEVAERVDRDGSILVPLQRSDVKRAVQSLLADGVTAIAVCLLWSPRNPAHELQVEEAIREVDRNLQVSLSHRIAPVLGEYERAATTAVNAYVAPVVDAYLRSVEQDLHHAGLSRPTMVIQADGGSTLADSVVPVRTIESGPAAGMVAVKALSEAIGESNVIATDVGGTTFKVGLLTEGRWNVARETVINQYTLALPMVDLVSIGAGGGSVAWVDGTRLRVGPQSAAADPGPACYGLGGDLPTVTDADVALGYIGTDRLLGGRIKLNRDLACSAIHDRVASALFGGDVTSAAAAVRRIVDAQMTGLVRKTTLERGYDPRRFVLMAYGGSGPVHAADYAAGLGIQRVIVPAAATVYSALGAALSDIRYSLERPINESLSDGNSVRSALDEMASEVTSTIARLHVTSDIGVEYWADVRYEKQLHSIRIDIDPESTDPSQIADRFLTRYRDLYGSGALLPNVGVRVLRVGVDGIGVMEKAEMPGVAAGSKATAPTHREVYWPDGEEWRTTDVWDGTSLPLSVVVAGPALIEFPGTTVSVPDQAYASRDRYGNVTLDLGGMA
jgi:N-methylhydantoinase A